MIIVAMNAPLSCHGFDFVTVQESRNVEEASERAEERLQQVARSVIDFEFVAYFNRRDAGPLPHSIDTS